MAFPGPAHAASPETHHLQTFVTRVEQRVQAYLDARPDKAEQLDHLRHVADRTRWLYYTELQRTAQGVSVRISEHEDSLIEACVYSHDIGKWLPRPELKKLLPETEAGYAAVFQRLGFTSYQQELFQLGVGRRLALEQDGYTTEYDSAHHLVSIYMLTQDPDLGFQQLAQADQQRLTLMIVGHQFGGYFKEQLFNLSMHDIAVTTGMLVEVARPERLLGDTLACAFHDADISDLLFVGSLERRPYREDILHTGGLIKILMINFTNLILSIPGAPAHLEGCLRSCQFTVNTACEEFMTLTAQEHGAAWRKHARRFLTVLRDRAVAEKFSSVLLDKAWPAAERLQAVRVLTYMQARSFLKMPDED
jgi:hypothetical protein